MNGLVPRQWPRTSVFQVRASMRESTDPLKSPKPSYSTEPSIAVFDIGVCYKTGLFSLVKDSGSLDSVTPSILPLSFAS